MEPLARVDLIRQRESGPPSSSEQLRRRDEFGDRVKDEGRTCQKLIRANRGLSERATGVRRGRGYLPPMQACLLSSAVVVVVVRTKPSRVVVVVRREQRRERESEREGWRCLQLPDLYSACRLVARGSHRTVNYSESVANCAAPNDAADSHLARNLRGLTVQHARTSSTLASCSLPSLQLDPIPSAKNGPPRDRLPPAREH